MLLICWTCHVTAYKCQLNNIFNLLFHTFNSYENIRKSIIINDIYKETIFSDYKLSIIPQSH